MSDFLCEPLLAFPESISAWCRAWVVERTQRHRLVCRELCQVNHCLICNTVAILHSHQSHFKWLVFLFGQQLTVYVSRIRPAGGEQLCRLDGWNAVDSSRTRPDIHRLSGRLAAFIQKVFTHLYIYICNVILSYKCNDLTWTLVFSHTGFIEQWKRSYRYCDVFWGGGEKNTYMWLCKTTAFERYAELLLFLLFIKWIHINSVYILTGHIIRFSC